PATIQRAFVTESGDRVQLDDFNWDSPKQAGIVRFMDGGTGRQLSEFNVEDKGSDGLWSFSDNVRTIEVKMGQGKAFVTKNYAVDTAELILTVSGVYGPLAISADGT